MLIKTEKQYPKATKLVKQRMLRNVLCKQCNRPVLKTKDGHFFCPCCNRVLKCNEVKVNPNNHITMTTFDVEDLILDVVKLGITDEKYKEALSCKQQEK